MCPLLSAATAPELNKRQLDVCFSRVQDMLSRLRSHRGLSTPTSTAKPDEHAGVSSHQGGQGWALGPEPRVSTMFDKAASELEEFAQGGGGDVKAAPFPAQAGPVGSRGRDSGGPSAADQLAAALHGPTEEDLSSLSPQLSSQGESSRPAYEPSLL